MVGNDKILAMYSQLLKYSQR